MPAAVPTTRSTSRGTDTPITEAVYSGFARGFSAEKAHLQTSPADGSGAVNAAVAASGMSNVEYGSIRTRLTIYAAYAKSNKTPDVSSIFPAADIAVLNAHKNDIVQMMSQQLR